MDGDYLIKDSEEGKNQESQADERKSDIEKQIKDMNENIVDDKGKPIQQDKTDLKRSLKNKFNYQERSGQTENVVIKQKSAETDPPKIDSRSDEANPSKIFDEYLKQFEKKEKDDRKKNENDEDKKKEGISKLVVDQKLKSLKENIVYTQSMKKCLKIAERISVLNANESVYKDYKSWSALIDKTDVGAGKGVCLPLWRFKHSSANLKHVTALCWNPKYKDLFAMGHGTYEFGKANGNGLIYCFSIKNPTYPEFSAVTDSEVMCLSFHPQEPSLLAVGLYDGTVLVYDIKCKLPNNRPIYQSNVRTKKHTDPVWQVSWLDAPLSKQQLCFYSISSDGRITSWTLQKNKLDAEDIIKLKMVPKEVTKESSEVKSETQASDAAAEVDEDATYYGYAGGMCFDFNKFNPSLFLVGTEEGNIHLCSKTYSGQYMETYEGHVLAVYAVRWNPFHESVFLSCSADWTIKMWEQSSKSPVCIFDLQSAINDIEWAPYSSTIFAAVTASASLHIYDLKVNKHSPMKEQSITKKSKPTHITFNPVDPIILIGDEKGGATLFRLSENLQRNSLIEKSEEESKKKTEEKDKKDHSPSKLLAKEVAPAQTNVRKNSFSQTDEMKQLAILEKEKMETFLKNQKKELY